MVVVDFSSKICGLTTPGKVDRFLVLGMISLLLS